MADSNIAGLPAGAAIADTDLIAGSDAGSGTLVKKTGLQFNTYIRQMLAALPTSDPHIVGALWNNGGLVAISFPLVRSLAGNTGTYALTGSTATVVISGAPTFQVDFTAISVLPAQVTLTRASAGTYFDSSGVVQSAAIDAPRFDYAYNGAAWVAKGLIIEESRTNLVHPSTAFTASWSSNNLTGVDAAAVAPDGTTTATKLFPTGTSNPVQYNPATTSGFTTCSVFAKAVEYTKASLRIDYPTGPKVAIFDLSIGTVISAESGMTASIQDCGAGWYRLIGTIDAGGSPVSVYHQFGPIDNGYSVTSGNITLGAADNTKGVYFWGAVEEPGTFATSYIPTVGATVTRSADVALLTGTASSTLEGSAASAILEAQLYVTTPAGTEVLFGKSPVSYSFVRTATTLSFFSGGADLTATFGSGNISSAFRTAISFDGSTRNIVINGGTLVSGSTVSAVTGDVPLGGFASGAQIASGHYLKMAIYNLRLTDSVLQSRSIVGTAF